MNEINTLLYKRLIEPKLRVKSGSVPSRINDPLWESVISNSKWEDLRKALDFDTAYPEPIPVQSLPVGMDTFLYLRKLWASYKHVYTRKEDGSIIGLSNPSGALVLVKDTGSATENNNGFALYGSTELISPPIFLSVSHRNELGDIRVDHCCTFRSIRSDKMVCASLQNTGSGSLGDKNEVVHLRCNVVGVQSEEERYRFDMKRNNHPTGKPKGEWFFSKAGPKNSDSAEAGHKKPHVYLKASSSPGGINLESVELDTKFISECCPELFPDATSVKNVPVIVYNSYAGVWWIRGALSEYYYIIERKSGDPKRSISLFVDAKANNQHFLNHVI